MTELAEVAIDLVKRDRRARKACLRARKVQGACRRKRYAEAVCRVGELIARYGEVRTRMLLGVAGVCENDISICIKAAREGVHNIVPPARRLAKPPTNLFSSVRTVRG